MKIDEQLAARFVCIKCKAHGGHVKRIAATGTGLSKLFDIQHNKFLTVSCYNCGYTEIYNPEYLEKGSSAGTILDILFG